MQAYAARVSILGDISHCGYNLKPHLRDVQPKERILIIDGSAKKNGETAALLDQVIAYLADEDQSFERLDLFAEDLRPCVGCNACILHGAPCPRDNGAELLERITGYDGLILYSPLFVGNVTAQLKLLIDKACWWVHRPQMVGAPALVVATRAGSKLR